MAIVALSASPATLDSGGSEFVSVTNTGAVDVTVSRGSQSFTLRPNQSRTVYPEGTAVTAVSSGTGQVTTLAQAAQVTQSQQVAANTAAIAALPNTYGQLLPAASSYTYNADGTVATETVAGITSTYTYNADGSVNTMTRSGVTRTFTYNTDGTIATVA